MNSFSFGSYFPAESVVHRVDARAKLLLGMAFLVIASLAHTPASLGALAAFTVLLYVAGRIPPGKAIKSLAPLLAIVVLVAVLNLFTKQGGAVLFQAGFLRISEAGVAQCLTVGARVLLMMMAMSLITLTTMTLDLTEAFERLLAPLARFGFPAHELGMMMGLALRFMPQFAGELSVIRHAQTSRGAGLTTSPTKGLHALSALIVPLFSSAFRHAETLSAAMEARCYHGSVGRTRLRALNFAPRDAAAALAIVALAAAVLAANLM